METEAEQELPVLVLKHANAVTTVTELTEILTIGCETRESGCVYKILNECFRETHELN